MADMVPDALPAPPSQSFSPHLPTILPLLQIRRLYLPSPTHHIAPLPIRRLSPPHIKVPPSNFQFVPIVTVMECIRSFC